jgi:hypothetical protein
LYELLKILIMTEKLYTMSFIIITGGGDTEEPEMSRETTHKDLTKEEADSLKATMEYGDFGCSFLDIEITEQ